LVGDTVCLVLKRIVDLSGNELRLNDAWQALSAER
jgi:hypothetical protein